MNEEYDMVLSQPQVLTGNVALNATSFDKITKASVIDSIVLPWAAGKHIPLPIKVYIAKNQRFSLSSHYQIEEDGGAVVIKLDRPIAFEKKDEIQERRTFRYVEEGEKLVIEIGRRKLEVASPEK